MESEPEQQTIITSDEPNIIVKASAGSGKSSVLVKAIAYYRKQHPKDRIDAITFTRAATEVLRARLSALGVYDVNISTIHVWARNYLEIYSQLYNFNLRVLNDQDIKAAINKIVADYPRRVDAAQAYEFIVNNKRLNLADRVKVVFEAIERRYIIFKRANGLYDFTDYPLYLNDILKKYDENILDTKALFVDELQDIDAEQAYVFERVKARKKFYIGDEKQMIYGFRGSSPEIFNRVNESNGFKTYTLKYNYRSYQEIVDYAMTVYSGLTKEIEDGSHALVSDISWYNSSDIHCTRGVGGSVTVVSPFGDFMRNNVYPERNINLDTILVDSIDEPQETADSVIQSMLIRSPQILCRTNKQVDAIKACGYFQVSTIHQAKGLEYDNVIVVDFPISDSDAINIAYVAVTRARDNVMIVSMPFLQRLIAHSSNYII